MRTLASAPRLPFDRRFLPLLAVGAGLGALAALALVMWTRHGTAAFYEMLTAGLGLCL